MKAKSLFLLPLIILAACNPNEPNNGSKNAPNTKFTILNEKKSPYLDWYLGNMESFISYSLKSYPQNVEGQLYENVRGTEDNTITLKNDIKIRVHDDYTLKADGSQTSLQLTRTAKLVQDLQKMPNRTRNGDMEDSIQHTYTYTIQTATPISIIRPEVNECTAIPLCYYDDMEIEWNEDVLNENGVVIVAEWNGSTISSPSQNVSIVNVDIVSDTGTAILNTDLFNDMPDEALVNLWLIRGDLITITGDGEMSLLDIAENSPEVIEELLSTNPELLVQLQPYMFGTGAVATFSFFLIREI